MKEPNIPLRLTHSDDVRRVRKGLDDSVQAVRELHELEHIIDVTGGRAAQSAVARHALPEFVESISRDHWKV